jgi:putative DNA primase/helicase
MSHTQFTSASPRASNHRKDSGKSPDVNFKNYCLSSNDLAVSRGLPYQWAGNHWVSLSDERNLIGLEQLSAAYLEKNFPDKATSRNVLSAAKFALLYLPELPDKPNEHIIPLHDSWLSIGKDGSLQAKAPDMRIGITYVINAKLGQTCGDYQPAPLPEDSMFASFLSQSLPELEIRNLIQEFSGYTLLNDVQMQKAQIWQGAGANGKSVLLKIISELHEKRAAMSLDKLEGFSLAQLVGASLAISSETPRGNINEEMLKAVITGDPITVNQKYKPEFTFSPSAKWIIACNEFPRISDKSDGIWRRFHVINWMVQIPENQRIYDLDKQIIKNELKLVLDWCLIGAQRLVRRGKFNELKAIQQASIAKRNENNNVAMFAEENNLTLASGNTYLIKDELYAKYREYCLDSGYAAHNKDNFFKQVYNLFPVINKDLKKPINGKWVRVVPLCLQEEKAPLTPIEAAVEQKQIDDIFGYKQVPCVLEKAA